MQHNTSKSCMNMRPTFSDKIFDIGISAYLLYFLDRTVCARTHTLSLSLSLSLVFFMLFKRQRGGSLTPLIRDTSPLKDIQTSSSFSNFKILYPSTI